MDISRTLRLGSLTIALLSTGLLVTVPAPLNAWQGRQELGAHKPSLPAAPRDASVGGTIIGAIVGGAVGFFGGAFLGASGDCYEICDEIVIGALVGEGLGMALGAYAANRGRGSLPVTLAAAGAVTGLGVLAAGSMGESGFWALVAAQVAAVTIAQVNTSPRVAVEPTVDLSTGGVGMSIRVRW